VKKLPANCVALVALPALNAREAEALIDLLGQLQGALWDTYGDAIAHQADDGQQPAPVAPSPTADDNDDSSAF
jgi:hypothetical protein